MAEEKKWLTLNQHGKFCLKMYICALSASDILTSQMDYLFSKDLVGYNSDFKDPKRRDPVGCYCLTDLGIETVKHYFSKKS